MRARGFGYGRQLKPDDLSSHFTFFRGAEEYVPTIKRSPWISRALPI